MAHPSLNYKMGKPVPVPFVLYWRKPLRKRFFNARKTTPKPKAILSFAQWNYDYMPPFVAGADFIYSCFPETVEDPDLRPMLTIGYRYRKPTKYFRFEFVRYYVRQFGYDIR